MISTRWRFALIPLLVALFGVLGSSSVRAGEGGLLLNAGANCSGSTATITFSWTADGAGAQWLDLSLANNGFADGTYLSAGALAPGQDSLIWQGVMTGRPHYWRVTTLGPGGWGTSSTGAFTPCAAPAAMPASPPAAPLSTGSPLEVQLIQSQNSQRGIAGLAPLTSDDRLVSVARTRANDMAARGYFGHTSPSGETAFAILSRFGISYGLAGENLARNNYEDGQSVEVAVSGFMSSSTHRANVLEARFSRVGVAVAYAGDMKYFVVVYSGP